MVWRNVMACDCRKIAPLALTLLLALSPALPASASESGTVLAYLIELFRRNNAACDGQAVAAPPPLIFSQPLCDAAGQLAARGEDVQASLAARKLKAFRYHVFRLGEARAEDAMARLKADHCLKVMEDYTHVGAVKESGQWWVIMATLTPLSSSDPGVAETRNGTAGAQAPPALQPTPAVATPQAAVPRPGPRGRMEADALPAEAKAIVDQINSIRGRGFSCGGKPKPAAPTLAVSRALTAAARKHASDMADKGYFGTTSPFGLTLSSRVNEEGYVWALITELISKGPPPASAVVDLWLSNPTQCEQLLEPGFSEIGAAFHNEYWTLILGRPAVGTDSPETSGGRPAAQGKVIVP